MTVGVDILRHTDEMSMTINEMVIRLFLHDAWSYVVEKQNKPCTSFDGKLRIVLHIAQKYLLATFISLPK